MEKMGVEREVQDGMNVFGIHLLVEFWTCNREKINDSDYLERIMSQAAEIAGAIVLKTLFKKFEPHGVSGVIMISSSHITIHTWPEYAYAAVDIFTCGPQVDPRKAVDFLRKELEVGHFEIRDFHRGIPKDLSLLS